LKVLSQPLSIDCPAHTVKFFFIVEVSENIIFASFALKDLAAFNGLILERKLNMVLAKVKEKTKRACHIASVTLGSHTNLTSEVFSYTYSDYKCEKEELQFL
jgi:hypothetical protein